MCSELSICCVVRSDIDSSLTALEYCVKQHGRVPGHSSILKMLISAEDADRLQKGLIAPLHCKDDQDFYCMMIHTA